LTQNVSFAEEPSQENPILPDSIPEPFYSVARDCLRLDPKQRSSIGDIRMRLRGPARSVPFEPEVSVAPQRALNRKLIFGIVLAAVLVGGVIFFSRGKNAPAPTAANAPAAAPPVTVPESAPTATPTASAPARKPASVPTPPVAQPAEAPKKAGDSAGEVLRQVLPDVPRSASNTINGTIKVAVQVNVDAAGKVTHAKFTSVGTSKYFANLALKAAERWEFSPPVVNGQPAESVWVLRFRFKRGGTQVSPERARR
jgi:TonB family protein